MTERTFAIDCDETIRANVAAIVNVYNKEFGTSLTVEDVKEYDVSKSFPLVQEKLGIPAHQFFFHDHAKEVFYDADVLPGAKEALDKLSKYGKIYIVTWQEGEENMRHTINWLEKNHIKHDGIFFSRDKSLIHANYLVDDCSRYFYGCNCEHAIMLNRPYNINLDTNFKDVSNSKTFDRFNNIGDFANKIDENNGEYPY